VTSILLKLLTLIYNIFIRLSLAYHNIVHSLNRIEQRACTFTACPCAVFCTSRYGEIIRPFKEIFTIGFRWRNTRKHLVKTPYPTLQCIASCLFEFRLILSDICKFSLPRSSMHVFPENRFKEAEKRTDNVIVKPTTYWQHYLRQKSTNHFLLHYTTVVVIETPQSL